MWNEAFCVITSSTVQCLALEYIKQLKQKRLFNVIVSDVELRFPCFSVFGVQGKSNYESIIFDLLADFF